MNAEQLIVHVRGTESPLTFLQPEGAPTSGWFGIQDGILSVRESQIPRRVRCFPLTSVETWEYDAGSLA